MLNVDLSTLRGRELRQLLATTRQRGDAALTYEILQEMEARRERGEPNGSRGSLFGPKRSAAPHPVMLSLGDPMDRAEEEELEAHAAPQPHDEPDEAPMYLHADREPDREPRRAPPRPPPPAPPPRDPVPRRWLWVSSGIALGLFVGLAIGGWADGVSRERPAQKTAPAAAAPSATPLNALPVPAAPVADPIAVETETAPDAIAPPAAPPVPAPKPVAAPPAAPAPAAAPVATEVAEADTADAPPAAPPGAKACAGAATPADKTICESPRLQKLQKQLRQAYAEALQAHQDRDVLRQRQLSWRDARNEITEPDDLAQLYEARIKKLNAATADARRQQ